MHRESAKSWMREPKAHPVLHTLFCKLASEDAPRCALGNRRRVGDVLAGLHGLDTLTPSRLETVQSRGGMPFAKMARSSESRVTKRPSRRTQGTQCDCI